MSPCITRRAVRPLALSSLVLAALAAPAAAQFVLPGDVKPTCAVTQVEFNSWFSTGSVTPNGEVEPANSVTFPNVPNCSFYKWSHQMFLWLTSPAPAKYGASAHVFNSPVFYDVSPDTNGTRTLIANKPGDFRTFGPRISQLSADRKQIAFDNTGKKFTVVNPLINPVGNLLVRDGAKTVEIERRQIDTLATAIRPLEATPAKGAKGAKGVRDTLLLRDTLGKITDLKLSPTLINGKRFLIDRFGNAVPTEQMQADGNVLMAQNGTLVYYALQVNDVYAYFLTGQKNGKIAATTFPTTPAALNSIEAYALSHSKTLPDANALALELKSSWIDATGLDTGKYVTIRATIPTYDKTSSTLWTFTGTKQATLAMVGMHVVGSAAGHPELIWATFEHVDNARAGAFSYTNTANATVNVPQNNGGTWTFSATPPSAAGPNNPLITTSGANVVALDPLKPIGPSDVLRVNAWGMPGSSTASNTEVIAINVSVIDKLAVGDVRKNYIMTGSTWTPFGAVPTGGNSVGTSQLANSTMETFFQPSNCFDCHNTSAQNPNMLGTAGGGGVSHIWGPITPLFPN